MASRPPPPNLSDHLENLQIRPQFPSNGPLSAPRRPPPPAAANFPGSPPFNPPNQAFSGPRAAPPFPGAPPPANQPFPGAGAPRPLPGQSPMMNQPRFSGPPGSGPSPMSQPRFPGPPGSGPSPMSQPRFPGPPGSGPPSQQVGVTSGGPPSGPLPQAYNAGPLQAQAYPGAPPRAPGMPAGGPPQFGGPTPASGPPGAQQPFGGPPAASGPPGGQQQFGRPHVSGPPTQPYQGGQQQFGGPQVSGQPTQSYSGGPQQFGGPQVSGQPTQSYSGGPQQFGGPQVSGQPTQSYSGGPQQFGRPQVSGPPPQSYPGGPPVAGPPGGFGGPPGSGPPLQQYPGTPPQYSGSPPAPFGGPPNAPFGSAAPWQAQGMPMMGGGVQQQQRVYGMPPGQSAPIPPAMGHIPFSGTQIGTPSKIDPNQIPRPMSNGSVVTFETRQGNQANIPPPAISDYIVKDCGNSSPRLMRCTINQIPCTSDLLATSSMPLALMLQPMALLHSDEEPIPVVDLGENGPVRCSRCKGYINPFMRFVDQGRRFICNLCGFTDETPREYHCNLGPDGRRRDADERAELCRGTVEFVATREFMVRDPMPTVFFFVIDVSMNAIQTGATAAACRAISQAIAGLPENPRTRVGIATFDSAIHFYNLKRALQQPLMLIVPDVHDVYTPLHTDLIVQLSECRQHLEQLLDNIPTMFENNRVAESAFGAAMKATFLALKPTGGKLLIFQSVLPSIGIGSLSSREAEGRANTSSADKEAHKLLQPADKSLKTMAIEFAEYQVCVDIFITTQTYVDIASISVVPQTTGGQVYYYYPFSALSDTAKVCNDLRWNISRPQGFEAVMRVRCSQGLQVQEYSGNFCKRIPTDIDLPAIDCDKTIMVTFKHDDKFQEGSECSFQCALLYTSVFGQRLIRVTNLSLPCTSMLSSLFRTADLDTQFACFLKQAASGIPTSPLSQVREQITNLCINILHSYRKFCATVSSSGQLILPEALKLLPLYTLALIKSIGLRNDGRLDDRSYWASHAASLSISLAVPWVYPRMISVHDLILKGDDAPLVNSTIPLSSENIQDDGVYLLENGEDALVYVGSTVNPDTIQELFGVSSADGIPTQLVLQQYDNDLSKKFNDVVDEIRRQRCSYLRLRLCRKGDPSGMLFYSYMVEDKAPNGLSYVEFLVHIHRQIQTKMT